MQIDRESLDREACEHIFVSGGTAVGNVLQAYKARAGQWWWLLVVELDGYYATCSFGSLLPYLAGKTSHIVHNIGDCAVCSGMNPLLWSDTETLVGQVLNNKAITSRLVSELPLKELPVIDLGRVDMDNREYWGPWFASSARGYTENGAFLGVVVDRMRGELDDIPEF